MLPVKNSKKSPSMKMSKSVIDKMEKINIPVLPDIETRVGTVFETGTSPDVRYRDIIHPDDCKCDMLYPEALALVVGVRATCIENGAQCFTSFAPGEDPLIIALREVADNKCPLSLLIPISVIGDHHRYELHSVNDLIKQTNLRPLIKIAARYLPNGL
jgi:hypothetical protein